jgi:hypothetical protein
MSDQNGQGPPWANVNAKDIIDDLSRQLGAQAVEMAAMRAYIDQLHRAIETVTASLDTPIQPADVP